MKPPIKTTDDLHIIAPIEGLLERTVAPLAFHAHDTNGALFADIRRLPDAGGQITLIARTIDTTTAMKIRKLLNP